MKGPRQPVSRVLCQAAHWFTSAEAGFLPCGGLAATIYLALPLPEGSSGQPGDGLRRVGVRKSPVTETAGPGTLVPLLGLAPDGVCLASDVTTGAVSSYLAVSPLPLRRGRGGMFLWHFPSGHPAPPLAGILPGGARTFLPPSSGRARGKDGGRPVTLSRLHFSMGLTPREQHRRIAGCHGEWGRWGRGRIGRQTAGYAATAEQLLLRSHL